MAYALSFAWEFFWGDGSIAPEEIPLSDRPTSVYQAILSLPDDQWISLARDVFDCSPDHVDPESILLKVLETNTCRNLDSPIEVLIDEPGFYTLLIHDSRKEAA